ncbi:membrane protein [Betaproteobacteria bacterium]|nr:membrane protein [Betaproteobacteria bacterium]
MAETVYSGLQGSGKSYEVVRGVILPNVACGRRIVTNVAGLNVDLIQAYAVETLQADPDNLGQIVHISNDDVTKKDFFPKENQDNAGAVVQGGDIIILDECWRWYVTGEHLPEDHLTFFRMHRHFTHPDTGQACDIVLIVQDIGDLQRKIRATVEKSFLMKKHKELGMDKHYSVTIFSGNRQTKAAIIEQRQYKYDSAIFALYSSYSQSNAVANKEEQADKRGNVFNRGLFKFAIPFSVIMFCFSSWYLWRFFHPEQKEKPSSVARIAEVKQGIKPSSPSPASSEPGVSSVWRSVGTVAYAGRVVFMVTDASGRVRYLDNPPAYKVSAFDAEVALPSGDIVTRWSGASSPNLTRVGGVKR